ncbi:hypothetical protein CR513_08499, partial [Mucuna pruriens]
MASYKSFKSRFVKIQATKAGHFCIDPRPLPLYWQEPPKFKGLVRGQLSLEAKVDWKILDSLPRGMNCKDIVSWISSNNATLCLKRMLKKQGVNMAELIKKTRLTNDARSTSRKVPNATTNIAATEKKFAAVVAEKDSALVVEKLTALAMSDKEAGKRKADSTTTKEAAAKKGKTVVPPPPPLPIQSKGKVVVTSGPFLMRLWFDVRGLFPTNRISLHDRGLLVSVGADNSIDMMTAYMARSMASLEVWRGLVRKAEHIVAKEAINKKELEKDQKARVGSLAEVQRMKEDSQKAQAEIEDLKAKLTASQAESASLKTKTAEAKTAATESEVGKLKEENVELADRVACLEGAFRQIALLHPDFDLSPYDMTKEVRDGKLISLLDSPQK